MKKTSLEIDEMLYEEAKKAALESGKSFSYTLSQWARLGRQWMLDQEKKKKKRKVSPVDLGGPSKIDLSSRRYWMDDLDEL